MYNNTTDLATELANYGSSPDAAKTIYLNSAIGNNGLTNNGDAVYLLNGGGYCGGGSDACTVDCISWDSANTCASLIAAGTRSYLPNADGYDDTALTSNEQQGQSVVNIQGTWYQSGPGTNQPNQASPYQYNIAEGGSPTALTLQTFTARNPALNLLAALALFTWAGRRSSCAAAKSANARRTTRAVFQAVSSPLAAFSFVPLSQSRYNQ